MTDYQLLFLCMTVMALAFMFFAEHYYTKYHKLLAQVNRDAFNVRTAKYEMADTNAKLAYWKERAASAELVSATERFFNNCEKTSN